MTADVDRKTAVAGAWRGAFPTLVAMGLSLATAAGGAGAAPSTEAECLAALTHLVDSTGWDASCAAAGARSDDLGNSVTSNSYASADLATGQLRAGTSAMVLNVPPSSQAPSGQLRTGGSGLARLGDTLTAVGPFTGSIPIDVTLTVDGSFSATSLAEANGTTVRADLADGRIRTGQPGFTHAMVEMMLDSDTDTAELYHQSVVGTAFVSAAPSQPMGSVTFTLTARFFVTPQSPSFSILAQLDVDAGVISRQDPDDLAQLAQVVTADFGQTARLSLAMPAGVSVTSESGVFLSAVPEPGSWLLLLGGLPLLAMRSVARRRPG